RARRLRSSAASNRDRSTARLTRAPAVVSRLSSSLESTRQSWLATLIIPRWRSPTVRGTLAWQRRLPVPPPCSDPLTTSARRLHHTTLTLAAPRRSPARKVDRQ